MLIDIHGRVAIGLRVSLTDVGLTIVARFISESQCFLSFILIG
ncbi:UNVERIFIED_CONTAM: hypothetical protein RKD50_009522 [Streptomyces canus]